MAGPNPYPGYFVLITDGQGMQHWVSPETAAIMQQGVGGGAPTGGGGNQQQGGGNTGGDLDALSRQVRNLLANKLKNEAVLVARRWFAANRTGDTDKQASDFLERIRKAPETDEALRRTAFADSPEGRRLMFRDVLRQGEPGFNAFPDVVQETAFSRFPGLESSYLLDPNLPSRLIPKEKGKSGFSFEDYLKSGRVPLTPDEIQDRLGQLSLVNVDEVDPENQEQVIAARLGSDPSETYDVAMNPYLEQVDPSFRSIISKMGRTRYEKERVRNPGKRFLDLFRQGSGSNWFGN